MRYVSLFIATVVVFYCCSAMFSQTVEISNGLNIKPLTKGIYLYVSTDEIGKWGSVLSNGLVVVDGKKALLIDTPMNDEKTEKLVRWIDDSLGVKVVSFVAGHWHDDCVGGLNYLNSNGVETYANQMTNDILESKGAICAKHGFNDSITLRLNNRNIYCYYMGGGHSTDNIVVWIPDAKVLFGGCMLKDMNAKNLGNTSDADMENWGNTVDCVMRKFNDAQIVVPGHGQVGGVEICEYTQSMLKDYKSNNK